MQAFLFFFLVCKPKGRSWSQAFSLETVETADKIRDVSQRHDLFCEESLEKIDVKEIELFRNGSVHVSVDYLGTIEYFRENFDGEAANWSGVVNFHCMQLSLGMSMRFIFGYD